MNITINLAASELQYHEILENFRSYMETIVAHENYLPDYCTKYLGEIKNLEFTIKNLESTVENLVKSSNQYITNVNNLEHKHEIITNGYTTNYLNLISSISILLTISVIISKNPVVSVLFLIGLFFNVACYLILLGINFIGLSYLLVYVGAVSILFLFILMLINVRVSELVTDNTNSIPLVLIVAVFFTYPIQQILPTNIVSLLTDNILTKTTNHLPFYLNNYLSNYLFNSNSNFHVTSKVWDGYLTETTHITSIGNIMYTNYSMWLIITSIILLLAMVGSIIITIKNTTDTASVHSNQ